MTILRLSMSLSAVETKRKYVFYLYNVKIGSYWETYG
jgi:hypothetical protein